MRALSSAVVDESAFPIYRRVARSRAERRGFWLDEYEADSAAQEIAIWLAVNAPNTISRGRRLTHHTPAYQARYAWGLIWRHILYAGASYCDELPDATPAPAADIDTSVDVRAALSRLDDEALGVALRLAAGEAASEGATIAEQKRASRARARVRAALAVAV